MTTQCARTAQKNPKKEGVRSASRRQKQWTWTDEVYDVAIFLLKGTGAEAQRFIDDTFNDGEPTPQGEWTGAKTLLTTGGGGVALTIWVPEWWSAQSSLDLGVLAHEALHGASYVLRERGIQFSEPSEEAFAYYVTWLYRNCHQRLVKCERQTK